MWRKNVRKLDFTEMMRALGYNRLISMENFRTPNFPLVAEILVWLIKRFDPDADVPFEYETEQDRVMFIRSSCQFMATKAHIKLNTKRLYQADGYAVRELIKVTSLLYDALRVNVSTLQDDLSSVASAIDLSSKVNELKQMRQLASQITAKGAKLYDLLGQEVDMRETRNNCMTRQVEMSEVEFGVKEMLTRIKSDISNTKQSMENVSSTESNLDTKIERKKAELERNEKRLESLKKVRPAYLDEVEKLEAELRQMYKDYIIRFRCVAYLEQQQDDMQQAELEKMAEREAATKRLMEQMMQEEKLMESSADLFGGEELKDDTEEGNKQTVRKTSRVRIKTASGVMRKASSAAQHQRRVFGGMNPTEEDDSGSLDSDSDLLLDGEGSELLVSEEDDEEELELGLDSLKKADSSRPQEHSDDDF